jgi:Uncharacterised nucleotidyltransferase
MTFLEDIGGVKTARKESISLQLARSLLNEESPPPEASEQLLKLARKNKVLLRSARIFGANSKELENEKAGVEEAFRLHDEMSRVFESNSISHIVIKSFDSLPDVGHDIDFLVPKHDEMQKAQKLLLEKFGAKTQALTHCDKLLGKFSCFLPGYVHDFELYPTISQLGEVYLDPEELLQHRTKEVMEGREVWTSSMEDRVLIRVIHTIFRHNFIKLSDIIDFLNLAQNSSPGKIIDKMARANICDAFLYYLGCIERFLRACEVENPAFTKLRDEAVTRFGPDRLRFLGKDRLVLPYRIPNRALFIIFMLKAGREAARGRWKSSLNCVVAPALVVMDFLSAAVRSGGRGMVW